ncbi:MAG: hypothetical protein QW587_04950 [Candidatus Bathyarchaeia archaeon]
MKSYSFEKTPDMQVGAIPWRLHRGLGKPYKFIKEEGNRITFLFEEELTPDEERKLEEIVMMTKRPARYDFGFFEAKPEELDDSEVGAKPLHVDEDWRRGRITVFFEEPLTSDQEQALTAALKKLFELRRVWP